MINAILIKDSTGKETKPERDRNLKRQKLIMGSSRNW